jgi:DNA-binding response OmpR family regulator
VTAHPSTELTPRVLLVDDRADNLVALHAVLEPLAIELVTAASGADALIALLDGEFALVVLDVQMPDMDGFETARIIRSRERTRLLPIIFLTAISGELEHHLAGYRSGAVDYVYKPFDPEILRAKVSVLVELWRRGHLIEQQREALAAEVDAVERLNAELQRSNAVLDAFATRAAEELLEPLDALAGYLELLAAGSHLGPDAAGVVARATALANGQRAGVAGLLDFARAGDGEVEVKPVDVLIALEEAAARAGWGPMGVTVTVEPGSPTLICADRLQLVRILELLVQRAVDSAGARNVTVGIRPDVGRVLITLADDGRTPDPSELAGMFNPTRSDAPLGNVICSRLVERHGGSVWAESREPRGSVVHVILAGEEAE